MGSRVSTFALRLKSLAGLTQPDAERVMERFRPLATAVEGPATCNWSSATVHNWGGNQCCGYERTG